MGRIADAVLQAERRTGGQRHAFREFLPTIDPEDAKDIVALLKTDGVELMALKEEVEKHYDFKVHRSSWENYRREAREGVFDEWENSQTS